MSERVFQQELIASMRSMRLCPVPIPDCGRATVEHVYDMGVLYAGQYFAIENKQVSGKTAWSFSGKRISDGQREQLRLTNLHGGVGLVCINFRLQPSEKRLKAGFPKRLDRAYFVCYSDIEQAECDGQTTFDCGWCASVGSELLRYKTPRRSGVGMETRWDCRFALIALTGKVWGDMELGAGEYYEAR